MTSLVILIFILAPTYIFKFNFAGYPTNLLMFGVFLLWAIFFFWLIIKKQFANFLDFRKNIDPKILIFVALFFLAGIASLFIKGADKAKFGQFIVLFLQPISIFFIGGFVFSQNPKAKYYLLLTTYYLLALSGLYAILQYFTLVGLPSAWWGNSVEPKRAISFFVHPNFYALWSAPLLALLVPDLAENLKTKNYKLKTFLWLLGALGLLFSFSRAGWLGLGAAIFIFAVVAGDYQFRRMLFATIIIVGIIIISTPNLRYRLVLPFYGDKSTVSRFSLWQTGIKGVKESPIFGLGLTGFSRQWETLNTDPGLTETHNFPHNIFLDFWVETGLLGLISFIALTSLYIYRGLLSIPRLSKEGLGEVNLFKLSVALFLIALLVQGQIDNPYFKNDLALVFWMTLALGML